MLDTSSSRIVFTFRLMILVFCFGIAGTTATAHTPLKFDEFGVIPCSEEIARLDNYGSQLRKVTNALAVVIIYGGRLGTREGEVAAHLFAIRDRLVNQNSIDTSRIIILDGGFLERPRIQLWMIPSQARPSGDFLVNPEASPKHVYLKRPALRTWEYKCSRSG